jgi:acylglycerol lipase
MSEWWSKYIGKVQNAGIFYPETDWIEIKSCEGYKLITYRYNNANPRGIICMLHGMYISSNDASHIAKRYFEEGYTVISIDQVGHGKSQGRKGEITSLQNMCLDTINFISKAKLLYPMDTPIFLSGLSMGGTLSVMISLARPDLIKGIVLCSPSLVVNSDLEPFLRKIVKCLNCCCGCINLKSLDTTLVTRNTDYIQFLKENPENYNGKMNVRTAYALLSGLEDLETRLKGVTTPMIVFQGGNDKVISAEETRKFVYECDSTDKEFVFFQDMYHDIYHDPEVDIVIQRSIQWVNARSL